MQRESARDRSPELHGYVVDALEVRVGRGDAASRAVESCRFGWYLPVRFGLDREGGDAVTQVIRHLAMHDHKLTPSSQLARADSACTNFNRSFQRRVSLHGQFSDSPNLHPTSMAEGKL